MDAGRPLLVDAASSDASIASGHDDASSGHDASLDPSPLDAAPGPTDAGLDGSPLGDADANALGITPVVAGEPCPVLTLPCNGYCIPDRQSTAECTALQLNHTLAIALDGDTLYVADNGGVFAVDTATLEAQQIAENEIGGAYGLALWNGQLFADQFEVIVRYDPSTKSVAEVCATDKNPKQLKVFGDYLYFVQTGLSKRERYARA